MLKEENNHTDFDEETEVEEDGGWGDDRQNEDGKSCNVFLSD